MICLFQLQIGIINIARREIMDKSIRKCLHYARDFKMNLNIQTQTELQKLKLICEKNNLISVYFLSLEY